jgi:hypothetical protein
MNQKAEREMIARAIKEFSGDLTTLEGAIGAYFTGKELGWKPMLLIHEKRTIRKYEAILGVNFREAHPEEGRWAKKSIAWRASEKISNFWKAVKGEIPGIRSPELS